MATLQQVADRAGVALSTVSFVLNENPRVSPETREVVLAAVKELRYTLGHKGRPRRGSGGSGSRQKRNLIVFLIPCTEPDLRMSGLYINCLEAAERALAKMNKGLIIRSMAQTNTAEDYAKWLSKVDGALMILNRPAKQFPINSAATPVVQLLGISSTDASWDQITYNNAAIGALAARYLLDRGHRRVAYFSPHPGVHHVEREKVFGETIAAGGGSMRVNRAALPSVLDAAHATVAAAMENILRNLLLTEPRPTALFIPSDYFLSLAHGMVYSIGLRPGRNIEIMSCDNDQSIMRGLHPRPASIELHGRAIGAAGAAQLLQRLETPTLPRSVRWFDPVVVAAEHPWPPDAV